MYVTFKLVNDGNCDYPEDIKCFKTEEEAEKYFANTDDSSIHMEEAAEIEEDFEIYQYLDITYRIGSEPSINFKTTTSLDKSKEDVNSIHSYGDVVYVDAFINNVRDGYRKLPKILDALDALFFNLREDEESTVHHKVGITNINKEEFFNMIK